MTLRARLESLKDRHATLETRISDEDHRPRPDSGTLAQLKVKKLRLKEEMERLQEQPRAADRSSLPASTPGEFAEA